MNISIPLELEHPALETTTMYMYITLSDAPSSIYHALVQENQIIFDAICYHVAMLLRSTNYSSSEKLVFFVKLERMINDPRYELYKDQLSQVKILFDMIMKEEHVLTV